MQKRGQVTIFIILGVIVIALISLLVVFRSNLLETTTETELVEIKSISEAVNIVNGMVQSCLDYAVEEAFYECSLVENPITCMKRELRLEFLDCVNFDNIDADIYVSNVGEIEINNGAGGRKIFVDMNYDIIIEKNGNSERLNKFHSEFVRVS